MSYITVNAPKPISIICRRDIIKNVRLVGNGTFLYFDFIIIARFIQLMRKKYARL